MVFLLRKITYTFAMKQIDNIEFNEAEEDQNSINGWERVDKYIEEKTLSGLIVGLIEADKILSATLKKQGYPGKTIDERIKSAKEKFNNLNGLLEARKLLKKILELSDSNINSLDIEDGILAYRQSLLDLQSQDKSHLGFFERFIIILDYYLPSKWKVLKKVLLYTFLFFFIIWFLANISIGQLIVSFIVNITNVIFSWVLAIILLILAVLIVIIASLIYFERRKRKKIN
jgi:hypothetical protein